MKAAQGLVLIVLLPAVACMCDDKREYEKDGKCCKMCGPGTRMSGDNCEDPLCVPCEDREFQESFTNEKRCTQQPYCDKNLNFEQNIHLSKTQYHPCMCKDGYHCSSSQCLTCVPHSKCGPGQEPLSLGRATHDTVCGPCSPGMFSNQTSATEKCQKWTSCASGYHSHPGNAETDTVCEKTHTTAIVLSLLAVVAVSVIAFIVIYLKRPDLLKKVYMRCQKNPPAAEGLDQPNNIQEVRVDDPLINLVVGPAGQVAQETEEPSFVPACTENNNPVAQEVGKTSHLPEMDSSFSSSLLPTSSVSTKPSSMH